ncbi:hypothetical protein [Spirillospora sp. NBC_01491]|uniref:hypothetical protein n=1 Tax=Spirillospora sp. NBC_01491 TaxID=2976007 RepID=UPI002E36529C|nr:hypothetical protein [Spirillospora sp. NBC_01491]
MNTIEFRVVPHQGVDVIDVVVDGAHLLDLVREAELPHARQEQRERAAEFAPDPAPLLAGDYTCLSRGYGWPDQHLLTDSPETMLLTCTCGIDECWPLMARVQVTGSLVRWSEFHNPYRDWDLSGVGPFTFSRTRYERALRRTGAPGREPGA